MKTWQHVLLGFLLGVLAVGAIQLASASPRGTPIKLHPPPTPGPDVVHISGAVENPGVYALPRYSRVQDAVLLAGGLTSSADSALLNLAAKVADGDKIHIPARDEDLSRFLGNNPALMDNNAGAAGRQVNLNTATQLDLEQLPGIGPTKARDILTYRQKHGPFQTVEELLKVPGIGQATLDSLRELVTVENTSWTP